MKTFPRIRGAQLPHNVSEPILKGPRATPQQLSLTEREEDKFLTNQKSTLLRTPERGTR